jgi:TrmH family RNA methyltransferase
VLEGELKGMQVWAADGGEGLQEYSEVEWGQGARAVVVGAEGAGLSEEVREAMGEGRVRGVRIPLEGEVESLNAAVAGSIILAEAQRQRRAQGTK